MSTTTLQELEHSLHCELDQMEREYVDTQYRLLFHRIKLDMKKIILQAKYKIETNTNIDVDAIVYRVCCVYDQMMATLKSTIAQIENNDKAKIVLAKINTLTQESIDFIQNSEGSVKVQSHVNNFIDKIKSDERILEGVASVKKSGLDITLKALKKIENVLDKQPESVIIHRVDYVEKEK